MNRSRTDLAFLAAALALCAVLASQPSKIPDPRPTVTLPAASAVETGTQIRVDGQTFEARDEADRRQWRRVEGFSRAGNNTVVLPMPPPP